MSEPSEYELTVKSTAVQVSIMSLRDWFAGQAMNGLLSDPTTGLDDLAQALSLPGTEALARSAYMLADAMLAERAKS